MNYRNLEDNYLSLCCGDCNRFIVSTAWNSDFVKELYNRVGHKLEVKTTRAGVPE